ncbi:hypothetical protein L1987_64789 [Smallanthus sonchifolius]|uniref:Uncharacterized protein n=1 Tax=Smallanthus sonchifolius TaxID=185202 RepID=A0ACB9BSQ2_9ASTR|nr:hypothetical protein L1987_64789 [Smallanthus sonchifolius]
MGQPWLPSFHQNNEKRTITVTRERVVKETTFSTTHEKTQVPINDGPSIPVVPTAEAGGESIPKDVTRYIDVELKLRGRDMRALGLLIMLLPSEIYHNLNTHASAIDL